MMTMRIQTSDFRGQIDFRVQIDFRGQIGTAESTERVSPLNLKS
jgi:hypothetical protein